MTIQPSHKLLPPDLGVVRTWIDAEGLHASFRGPLNVDYHNSDPGKPEHGWTADRLLVDAFEKVTAGMKHTSWCRVSSGPQESVFVQVVRLARVFQGGGSK